MKKFIILFILIILITSGCKIKGSEGQQYKPDGIYCDFNVIYNGTEIEGTLSMPKGEASVIVIKKPALLSGFTITSENGNITAEYLGMTVKLPVDKFPALSFSSILTDVLRNEDGIIQNGEVKGKIEGFDYTLLLDENDMPVSLSVPKQGFEARFNNSK